MKGRIAFPRLLPTTMAALAALLSLKSVDLVRAAVPAQAEEPTAHPSVAAPPSQQPARAAHGSEEGRAERKPDAKSDPKSGGRSDAKSEAKSEAKSDQGPAPGVAAKPEAPPVSDAERGVLLELRQRRQELEARDTALAAREAVLGAAERKIAARVDELQALQTRLEALETARRARDETNWRGMVKLYESMKPRDAAAIFNDLDMPVLLEVVDRMKEAKAAAVLAAMQPEKARQVTTALADMRTHANADPVSPPAAVGAGAASGAAGGRKAAAGGQAAPGTGG